MDIKRIAYEKYKLHWMLSHGYTLVDLIKEMQLCVEVIDEEDNIDLGSIFNDWEFNYGFGSEIWVCYEEFLENEYKDKEYMRAVLDDIDFKQYCEEK
jgi:hypothetical protein